MPYSRPVELEPRPDAKELTAWMAGIGLNFAVEPNYEADIELTLIHASELGMEEADHRVLAMLTTWLGVHHRHVHADRLYRALEQHESDRVRAYWSAIASWLASDRRFTRLGRLHEGAPADLLSSGTEYQLARRGDDERFGGSALRVPAGVLRDRATDVLEPVLLATRHRGYRNRVRMGATWRADVWTVLEADPDVTVAEAARRARCSFAVAWEVARDFAILQPGSKDRS
ncbi:MAG: hypothetical protein GY711_23450 [bacterium]|nr:hypothetical protein [bacterium]